MNVANTEMESVSQEAVTTDPTRAWLQAVPSSSMLSSAMLFHTYRTGIMSRSWIVCLVVWLWCQAPPQPLHSEIIIAD